MTELASCLLLERPNTNDLDRVLEVDGSRGVVWLFNVKDERALPRKVAIAEIEAALARKALRIRNDDPYLPRTVDEDSVGVGERERYDNRKNAIAYLMSYGTAVFSAEWRGTLVARLIERNIELGTGLRSKPAVYAALRTFFRGGLQYAALWEHSRRSERERLTGGSKRGRTSRDERQGLRLPISKSQGNYDRSNKGYEKYHLKRGLSIRNAYVHMLAHEYGAAVVGQGRRLEAVLPKGTSAPSFHQFKKWGAEAFSKSVRSKKSKGEIGYEREDRPLELKVEERYDAPGRYEIDWTPLPIWLVSSHSRLPLGTAILYLVVDVFSRMVVGFSLTFENPSWETAMDALLNAFSPKKPFLDSLGIVLPEDAWPAHHLCNQLVSDNGEIRSKAARCLPQEGIDYIPLPPSRPDAKGFVESKFGHFDKTQFMAMAGHVADRRDWIHRHFRDNADRTIEELTVEVADIVVTYNNSYVVPDYSLTSGMLKDGVLPIPRRLWTWGIENRSGQLIVRPVDYLGKALMRGERARVTRRGLKHKSLFYRPQLTDVVELLDTASRAGTYSVDIRVDRRRVGHIYLVHPDGEFEECSLSGSRAFRNMTVAEYEAHQENYLDRLAVAKHDEQEAQMGLKLRQELRGADAAAATAEAQEGLTKTQIRTGGSRHESQVATSIQSSQDGADRNDEEEDPWADEFLPYLEGRAEDEEE